MLPRGQPGSQGLLPTRGWRMLPEMLLLALPQRDVVRGALLPSQAPILFSVARTCPVCGTEVIQSVPLCSCLTGASCPVLLNERGVPGWGGGDSEPDLKTPQVLEARPRPGQEERRQGRPELPCRTGNISQHLHGLAKAGPCGLLVHGGCGSCGSCGWMTESSLGTL